MFFKSMDPLPQTNPSLTTPANLTVTASSWSAREHKKIRSASFREDLPTSTPSRRQSIPWCTFSVPAPSRPECAQSCHRRIDAPLVFPLWQVDLVIYRHHIRVRIHQVRPVGCTHTRPVDPHNIGWLQTRQHKKHPSDGGGRKWCWLPSAIEHTCAVANGVNGEQQATAPGGHRWVASPPSFLRWMQ